MDKILEYLLINLFKENDVIIDNEEEDSYMMNLLLSHISKNILDINLDDFSSLDIREAISFVVKKEGYKIVTIGDFLFYYKDCEKLGKYLEEHFKYL